MDPLNASAITGAMQAPHDGVAALMEEGQGGLYAHAGGDPLMALQSSVSLAHAPAWHFHGRPCLIRFAPIIRRHQCLAPANGAWT